MAATMEEFIEVASELILRANDSSTEIEWNTLGKQTNSTADLKQIITGRKLSLDDEIAQDALIDCFEKSSDEQKHKLYHGFWCIICSGKSFDAFSNISTKEIKLQFTRIAKITREHWQSARRQFKDFVKTKVTKMQNINKDSELPKIIWGCDEPETTNRFLRYVSIIVSGTDYRNQTSNFKTSENPNYCLPLFVLYHYFEHSVTLGRMIDSYNSTTPISGGSSTPAVPSALEAFNAALKTALTSISAASETFATQSSSSPNGGNTVLKEELKNLETKVFELTQEVATKETQLNKIQAQLTAMEQEKNAAQQSSFDSEKTLTELQEKHASTNKELTTANALIEKHEKEISTVKSMLEDYQELERLVNDTTKLQAALDNPSKASNIEDLYKRLTKREIRDFLPQANPPATPPPAANPAANPQTTPAATPAANPPATPTSPSLLELYDWEEVFGIRWEGTEIISENPAYKSASEQTLFSTNVTSGIQKAFDQIHKNPLENFVRTDDNREALTSIRSDPNNIFKYYNNLKDIQARIQLVCLNFFICTQKFNFSILNSKKSSNTGATKYVEDIIFAIAVNVVEVLENKRPTPFVITEPISYEEKIKSEVIDQLVIFFQCFNVTIDIAEGVKSETPTQVCLYLKNLFETKIVPLLFDNDTWNYISVVQEAQNDQKKAQTSFTPKKITQIATAFAAKFLGRSGASTSVSSTAAKGFTQETFRIQKGRIYSELKSKFQTFYVFGVQFLGIAGAAPKVLQTVDYDKVKTELLGQLKFSLSTNPFSSNLEAYKTTITDMINAVDTFGKKTDARESVKEFKKRADEATNLELLQLVLHVNNLKSATDVDKSKQNTLVSEFNTMNTQFSSYFSGTSSTPPNISGIQSLTTKIQEALKKSKFSPPSAGGGGTAVDYEEFANKFLKAQKGRFSRATLKAAVNDLGLANLDTFYDYLFLTTKGKEIGGEMLKQMTD